MSARYSNPTNSPPSHSPNSSLSYLIPLSSPSLACSRDRTDEFYSIVGVREHTAPKRLSRDAQARRVVYEQLRCQRACSVPRHQLLTVALTATEWARDHAKNDQERLHFCVVEQLIARQIKSRTGPRNEPRLTGIERRLVAVEQLFETVHVFLEEHDHKLDGVERNVEKIVLRIDASARELEDAAPRSFRTRRAWWFSYWPRSLPAKLRLAFFCLVLGNLLLFYWGYL